MQVDYVWLKLKGAISDLEILEDSLWHLRNLLVATIGHKGRVPNQGLGQGLLGAIIGPGRALLTVLGAMIGVGTGLGQDPSLGSMTVQVTSQAIARGKMKALVM